MSKGYPSAAGTLLILPIHALSLDEAALLARDLPNLGRIFRGEFAADGFAELRHRELALQMLKLVQGHPKLIELAEGQATDPQTLQTHLTRAESAYVTGSAPLAAFFEQHRSALNESDFLGVLADWTQTVSDTLPADARLLFSFLCGLEEPDRTEEIVEQNWSNVLRRMGTLARLSDAATLRTATSPNDAANPASKGNEEDGQECPSSARLFDILFRSGLVKRQQDSKRASLSYGIHPGVAEAGRALAGDTIQSAVDQELGAFWEANFYHGINTELQGGGPLIRLAAAVIRFQTQDGQLPNTIHALRIVIGELSPDSSARALLTPDGSGFDHVVELVEQIEGVRFRELFERLPKTRAATGTEALALAAQAALPT